MGCGKSSHAAKYLLEKVIRCGEGSTFRAMCIQPNGIVAMQIATRIAHERWMEKEKSPSFGYWVSLETKPPR